MKLAKDRLLELVAFVEPGSDDVTYTHAVFAQCFLPIRRLPMGANGTRCDTAAPPSLLPPETS